MYNNSFIIGCSARNPAQSRGKCGVDVVNVIEGENSKTTPYK